MNEQTVGKNYQQQVELLLNCLPYVAQESCFALKGGTAINLFYQDMPRLSVDIDLTYLPIQTRNESLHGIEQGLLNIKAKLEHALPGVFIQEKRANKAKNLQKLFINHRGV